MLTSQVKNNQIIVYTSITGGYDRLQQPFLPADGFVFICFVEKGKKKGEYEGAWKIMEIPFDCKDNQILSRYPKINPHEVLPEDSSWSLWIDGNIQITDGSLYEKCRNLQEADVKYAGVRHISNDCAYEEVVRCLIDRRDSIPNLIRTIDFLRKNNYPEHTGMMENNMIFRKHADETVKKFDVLWWEYFLLFSHRDQLTHGLCLSKVKELEPVSLLPDGKCARNYHGVRYVKHPTAKLSWIQRKLKYGLNKPESFLLRQYIRLTRPKKVKVFIYPTFDSKRDKTGNRYIQYFRNSFSMAQGCKVINRFSRSETLGILLNLDAEVFILHWADLVPSKPLGWLQSLFFKAGVSLAHLLGKKTVWVLHNKTAHNDDSPRPASMMEFMSRKASLVITHSKEGVSFFKSAFPDVQAECVYIPHPVYSEEMAAPSETKYDFIVWGNISPRKRILDFVKYVSSSPELKRNSFLICGRCRDNSYDAEIRRNLPANITYENSFLTEEELSERIRSANNILFTYSERSVLSSGALIYSLNFGKPIIGPRVGSFADLTDIVKCYDTFDDIKPISHYDNGEAIMKYIRENTWKDFAGKVLSELAVSVR